MRRQGEKPVSETFTLKADAVVWARQMEAQADRVGLPADPRALHRTTLSDVLIRYRDTVVSRKRACPGS